MASQYTLKVQILLDGNRAERRQRISKLRGQLEKIGIKVLEVENEQTQVADSGTDNQRPHANPR